MRGTQLRAKVRIYRTIEKEGRREGRVGKKALLEDHVSFFSFMVVVEGRRLGRCFLSKMFDREFW